jgi:hypothetical protein
MVLEDASQVPFCGAGEVTEGSIGQNRQHHLGSLKPPAADDYQVLLGEILSHPSANDHQISRVHVRRLLK